MTADPEAAIEALKQRFLARCETDLVRLQDYADGGQISNEELYYLVHRLSGAAGVFGFDAISALAGELEVVLLEGRTVLPLQPLMGGLKDMLEREADLGSAASRTSSAG
ncbi:MAG TPA: Hpt domain-containing protein [Caulobacteraceae bacterium]|jgi:HPt (histidine-containing phosphotransfer) domain-containing protein|nr:Hpt domain-containing protein [Caulobacteraceae bacterium]